MLFRFVCERASGTIAAESSIELQDDDPKRRSIAMKSTAQKSGLSFRDVIGIFWEWRQASISVEVCFFGKAETSETVRVSIDGLVSLVDPEGIVTVSGDGREIELDLRGCEFQHAWEAPGRKDGFDPLDPDSILQLKFPNGEICLVF